MQGTAARHDGAVTMDDDLQQIIRQALDDARAAGRDRLPSGSDVNLLCNGQCVIDLYAKIPDGALDLAMAQEQLDRPQVAGSSVDQGRLGPAKRMGAEE